jgi:hypothetical protein
MQKNYSINETDDDSLTTSTSSVSTYDLENSEQIDEDEVYQGDVESLSDDTPIETIAKQNQTSYSNLILFPELVILGLEIVWQNVDNEWSDQQNTTKTSVYVSQIEFEMFMKDFL